MNIKEEVYKECVKLVHDRFDNIKLNIENIENNLLSETKSSAGDKHETGRAMLQLEREKAGVQLFEINKIRVALHKVDINKKLKFVSIGSLVFTSKANYFLSVSLGLIEVKDIGFFAISPQTPIGQLLMGKTVGDTIEFNGNKFNIEKIE